MSSVGPDTDIELSLFNQFLSVTLAQLPELRLTFLVAWWHCHVSSEGHVTRRNGYPGRCLTHPWPPMIAREPERGSQSVKVRSRELCMRSAEILCWHRCARESGAPGLAGNAQPVPAVGRRNQIRTGADILQCKEVGRKARKRVQCGNPVPWLRWR
jgi:hypothetical protein